MSRGSLVSPSGNLRCARLCHGCSSMDWIFQPCWCSPAFRLALWRRLRDEGALALESLSVDFLPLAMLFAISVTGLALTASTIWLRGAHYHFLAILHAITVIAALLYLPFGKFFHIFQRPAQLGVKLYQKAGEIDGGAICARCGTRFASQMQIEDLREVLPQIGFDFSMTGPARALAGSLPAVQEKEPGARATAGQGERAWLRPPLRSRTERNVWSDAEIHSAGRLGGFRLQER